MTTVADYAPARAYPTAANETLRIALLGLGNVGAALASLVSEHPPLRRRFAIAGALVRDPGRWRGEAAARIPLTTDGLTLLTRDAGVVIEALGGLEPARSLVLTALERGIAVVTANKSLLAAHGDELFAAAQTAGVPLRYEASVIAGVPFLGTFAGRPLASDTTAIAGIVNGTSNYVLSEMGTAHVTFGDALAAAQTRGYAEPDPANDVDGIDAVQKLCVLLRHFGGWSVRPCDIEATGIAALQPQDLEQAAAFGGAIRPVVVADWRAGALTAFAGPAFVADADPLARVDGVRNAIALRSRWSGDLFFSGPGAGPAVTAATLLDDAVETAGARPTPVAPARAAGACSAPETGWFVRVSAPRLPDSAATGDLLRASGVSLRRTSSRDSRDGCEREWLLTHPCPRTVLVRALAALSAAGGCRAFSVRTHGIA